MTHGGMVDVILAEEATEPDVVARPGRRGAGRPGDAIPPTDAGGRADQDAGTRDRHWRAWVVGLAVLTVAGVGITEADAAHERAARLAEVPGVLSPLGGPVEELWRRPGGSERTVLIDGDVLVATFLTEQDHVLTATDTRTGDERWTAPLPEVRSTRDLDCAAVGDPEGGSRSHVVCRLVTESAAPVDGVRGFAGSRLVVFDARTGARVAQRDLHSRYSSIVAIGDELLVVERLADGHGGVMREDPVTGSVLWTFRTEQPLPVFGVGPVVPDAEIQHGVIVADGPVAWAFTPAGSLL